MKTVWKGPCVLLNEIVEGAFIASSMVSNDWLRPLLYLAFVIVFHNAKYNSLGKLYTENTAFIQEQKTALAIDYPSVAMCPSTYGEC